VPPLSQRYLKNATAAAAKRTGEEILGVAFCNRAGSMRALVAGEVLQLGEAALGGGAVAGINAPAGAIQREGGKKTRLPLNFVVAITPARVHVFKHRMFWGSVKLKSELGVFDRAGLQVGVRDGAITKQFMLHSPGQGQTMAFEMTDVEHTREIAALLQREV
jgi:hypothetical protein